MADSSENWWSKSSTFCKVYLLSVELCHSYSNRNTHGVECFVFCLLTAWLCIMQGDKLHLRKGCRQQTKDSTDWWLVASLWPIRGLFEVVSAQLAWKLSGEAMEKQDAFSEVALLVPATAFNNGNVKNTRFSVWWTELNWSALLGSLNMSVKQQVCLFPWQM